MGESEAKTIHYKPTLQPAPSPTDLLRGFAPSGTEIPIGPPEARAKATGAKAKAKSRKKPKGKAKKAKR